MKLTNNIEIKLEEIIKKYWNEEYEYYSSYTDNGFEAIVEIEDYLKNLNVEFESDFTDGYDSPGYGNSFYAVAYVENGKPKIFTIMFETM